MARHKPDTQAGRLPGQESFEFQVELGNLRFHLFIGPGFFRTKSDWNVLNHNHALYEIQFVLKGTVVLNVEEGRLEVPEGGICVIPPGMYHSQLKPRSGEDVHKSCFSFRYEALSQRRSGYPPDETAELLRALNQASFFMAHGRRETLALLEAIREELRARPIGYFAKVQCLFAQILIDVIRSSPAVRPTLGGNLPSLSSGEWRAATIDAFFSEHFGRPLAEDELANLLHVSRRQLNRILHDLYGMSFRRKLRVTRIKVAMDLLRHTKLSVKEIAEKVGYPFAENFHAQFKAMTNMTPTRFRQESNVHPNWPVR